MNKLIINKYISEKDKDLISQLLSDKNKNLLISPMKSGKTTFIFKYLLKHLNQKEIQLIFVAPKTTLLEQLKANYDVTKCYGKRGGVEIKENTPVITTPDSLFKVINECQELKKEFFIVYDEAHELELSYNFRKKLAYPVKYYEHGLCTGLLCMTATPDNILKSMAWDNIFSFDVKEKFVQAPVTNIITGLKSTPSSIAKYIIDLHSKDNVTKVIRINNKDTINEVAKILKDTINIEPITWYRSREKDNEKGDTHLQAILEGAKLGNEIILTTSLVDVGVEIYSEVKPIVITFMDNNSSLIEEIQFIGRFRDGVKEFNIITPNSKLNTPFKPYEVIQEQLYNKYNIDSALANEYDKEYKTLYPNLSMTIDDDGHYSYEIDTFAVNSEIFQRYISQIAKEPHLLRRYLKDHLTFNSEIIRIVNINENNLSNEEVDQISEKLKAAEEEKKELFKTEIKALREKIEGFSRIQTYILLVKEKDLDLLTIHDKKILSTIEEEYKFYHSEDMKEYRKRYYKLEDYIKKKGSEKELLLNILDDKWYKKFEKQFNCLTSNRKFNKGFPLDPDNKLEVKVYTIRNTIIKMKGKEVNIRLSDKFKQELLVKLKENKCFTKLPPKSLEKHLTMIYNTSDSIIKSTKTNIIL